jgi:FkbH-like protein
MPLDIPFTPRLLGESLKNLNVLILGTCQVYPLVGVAPHFGYKARHMLFDSYRHSTVPAIDTIDLDAAIVAMTLRQVAVDVTGQPLICSDMFLARIRNSDEAEDLLDQCELVLNEKLTALHASLREIPTFFMSFFEPSFNYKGNLINQYDPTSPRFFMRKLNEKFHNLVRNFGNFYFIDSNDIINFVGRMHLQDDAICVSTHASFIGEADLALDGNRMIPPKSNFEEYQAESHMEAFGLVFWNLLSDNLKILRHLDPIKLIIIDLDDTLWRGLAAEDNVEHWVRVEGWPLGFVESLLYFKGRGGLLAICSKNDYEPTVKQLNNFFRGTITAEDFSSIKINWKRKSENIAEILSETNLLPENVVFIDDNPREIDEVRARYPSMRFLGGNHYDWRKIVLRSPETQVAFVTEESSQRTKLIHARVEREALSKTMSRVDWLASLKIEQSFFLLRSHESKHFERAFELLNKTNQFNTTGRRWQRSELLEFFGDGGICLLTSLKDRTVDNGVIGLALILRGAIVQAVLSCRVFDLGAEVSMGRIATLIALTQAEKATGSIIDTGKNFACHKYFENIGFKKQGEYFEGVQACAAPDWISVSHCPGLT